MDEAILSVLVKHHYVESFEKRGRMPKRVLDIKLKYDNDEGAIHGLRFISKPSRHLYIAARQVRPVHHGYGLLVLTTSAGIMSGAAARKKNLGGEALFEIW